MNRRLSLLLVAGVLLTTVALLVVIAAMFRIDREIVQVVMIFVGMLAMASLSALSRYGEAAAAARLVPISFNEAQARHALDHAVPFGSIADDLVSLENKKRPWDLTPDALMAQDSALALAKLRIDVEQQLRRIAYQHKIGARLGRGSIERIVDALETREVIDPSLSSALRDVLSACNLAIHGGDVTPEVATNVLNIGEDIIRILLNRS